MSPSHPERVRRNNQEPREDSAEAALAQLQADYQRMLSLCGNHQPDIWEGDGTCVLCDGNRLHQELAQLQAAVREVAQECDDMLRLVDISRFVPDIDLKSLAHQLRALVPAGAAEEGK